MLIAIIITLAISMGLILIRAILGPSIYDRILAGNAFGTTTVIMIALLTLALDNPMYLDIALIYALINFVTTIAFLRYFQNKTNGRKVQ